MAKNLVIVESPAKSRTLARFLGRGFDIQSTVGHIIDLPKSKLGVDVDSDFLPQYEVIKGKEKVIADLKKAAKKADTIYLAPDPDREGEAIAWHVANSLKGIKGRLMRVTFNEITKAAVINAIENPRKIDMNLVNAQQARRILDRLVGYTISPILWKTVARNLSAGRVQSVALRLVCEREEEIKAFVSEEYWKITALLNTKSNEKFTADLLRIDGKTVVKGGEKGKNKLVISSKTEIDKHLIVLKKAEFRVYEIKQTQRERRAPAPFITSTLQQEAAKVFGFSPKRTMSIAQKLYEGIEMGKEGPTGLITYMRTDSTRVSSQALTAVRKLIKKEFGAEYMPAKPNFFGKKKSAQDAHEAVRPTYLDHPPDRVKKHLTIHQLKLYTLIWNRFVASQMNPAKFAVETVDIMADKYLFRAVAQKQLFDGFLRIYHEEKEADDNTNGEMSDKQLPDLQKEESLLLKKLTPTQSFTRPPARYSEAMLVKRMEADGIGRPSTYASIVATIRDRKYVELTERKLHPTYLGIAVNKILADHFPKLFNVDFTAAMEKELDLVEEGTDDWVKVVRDFYDPFMKMVNALKGKEAEIKASITEKTDIECPKCSSLMVIKMGRHGRFLACSAYPKCKTARPLPEDEEKTRTGKKCEKCGSEMIIKTGRYGRFMACSGYPECKNTKPVTLGITCPRDGCGGEVVEKQSRNKRIFYGCTNYPKCEFASWDKPVNRPCPLCKYPYMLQKVSKTKGDYLACPDCKHKVHEEIQNVSPVH